MSILLHRSTRSGSFCWGHELFCSSVEASFLGLVMRPSVDQQLIHSLSSGVGLFLCSSKWGGAVLQHQKWGGAVLQISNNFVSSHSSVMPILYAADTGV